MLLILYSFYLIYFCKFGGAYQKLNWHIELSLLSFDDFEQVTMFSDAYHFYKTLQNRCGFEGKGEIWVNDILNLGIS